MDAYRDPVAEVLKASMEVPKEWAELPMHRALRWLRRRLTMTQRELAERAGMTRCQVARVERGVDVKWNTLRRLCEAMGCGAMLVPVYDKGIDELRKSVGMEGDRWDRRRERRRARYLAR